MKNLRTQIRSTLILLKGIPSMIYTNLNTIPLLKVLIGLMQVKWSFASWYVEIYSSARNYLFRIECSRATLKSFNTRLAYAMRFTGIEKLRQCYITFVEPKPTPYTRVELPYVPMVEHAVE